MFEPKMPQICQNNQQCEHSYIANQQTKRAEMTLKEIAHKAIIEYYTDSRINDNNFFAPRIFFISQNKKAYIELFSIKSKMVCLSHNNGESTRKDNYYEIILFHTMKYNNAQSITAEKLINVVDNIQKELPKLTPFYSFDNKKRMFYTKIVIVIYAESKEIEYISRKTLDLVKYSDIREQKMFRYLFVDYLILKDGSYIYQEETEIFTT